MRIRSEPYLIGGLLILLFLIGSLSTSPLVVGYGHDREIFRYVGMMMTQGGIPYLDAIDNKPPAIFILHALGHMLSPGPWGSFLVMKLVGVLALISLFQAARQTLSPRLSFLLCSLWISWITYDKILEGGGLSRELVAYLSTVILVVIFQGKRSFGVGLQVGLLVNLIFYTQQNEILAMIPLLIYLIVIGRRIQWRVLYGCMVGGLVVHLITLGGLGYVGALEAFWEQCFQFNTELYFPEQTLLSRIDAFFTEVLFGQKRFMVFYPVFLLSVFPLGEWFWRKQVLSPRYVSLIAALFLQLFSSSLSGWTYAHYFLAWVPLWVGLLWHMLFRLDQLWLKISLFTYLGIFLLLKVGVFSQATSYQHNPDIFQQLQSVRGQKGQVYTFQTSYLAYNSDLAIMSPSPYVLSHYFRFEGFDPTGEKFDQLLADIDRANCQFIFHNPHPLIVFAPLYEDKLQAFLENKYEEIFHVEDGPILYRRKPYTYKD